MFFGRYYHLTLPYRVSVTTMANDIMTGVAWGAGNAYHFGIPDFTSGFHRGTCCPVICVSLFQVIVLSFGFFVLICPFVWLHGIYIFFTFVTLKKAHCLLNRKSPFWSEKSTPRSPTLNTNMHHHTSFLSLSNVL